MKKILSAFILLVFLCGCEKEASGLSGETKWSKCFGIEIPVETEASVAGVYEGKRDNDATQRRAPGKVTLSANRLTKPQILVLTAYEPVTWDISSLESKLVRGVIMYGYYSQQLTGADSSVPIRRVIYRSDIAPTKNDRSCGDYHTVHKGGIELDSLVDDVTKYAGVPVVRFAGGYNPSSLKLDGGYNQGEDLARDARPPKVDKHPGSILLSDLVAEGAVRLATAKEVSAWNQAATARLKSRYLAPYKSESLGLSPTYTALKAFNVPDGMYGGNRRLFIVPQGVPAPSDKRSHNAYYFIESGICIGTDPDCQRR